MAKLTRQSVRQHACHIGIAGALLLGSFLATGFIAGCGGSTDTASDQDESVMLVPSPERSLQRDSCMPKPVARVARAPRSMKGTIEEIASGRCTVGAQESATGTATGLRRSYELWILVEIGGFYPQQPLTLDAQGFWETDEVLFGGPGTFNVYLVAAGPKGQRRFEQYFSDGADTGAYNPISRIDLPPDVYFLSRAGGLRRPN